MLHTAKNRKEIIALSMKTLSFSDLHRKLIVIAHTATTNAIKELRALQ
jgi:predicted metal-dependent TIM-barrel fold hydrolase